MRRTLGLLTLAIALAAAAPAGAGALPPVRHVFTIVLENETFQKSFVIGQLQAPYLVRTLPSQGALVVNYFGTGHSSLDNYIAMTSGQSPNPKTQDDCNDASTMGDAANPRLSIDADGQAIGVGCTYPRQVRSIADQLDDKGLMWKGYMEDMGAPCHTPGSGPQPGDYKTKHNPFVYFHSVTDRRDYCDARDVPLKQLEGDLRSEATTPNFALIVPNQCNDGHDEPTCSDGSTGGLVPVDLWLRRWVPTILGSPAFKHDGLLIITWDEGDLDATSCCDEPKGPNLDADESNGQAGPTVGILNNGGGQTGAVMISPFIAPGTVSLTAYNHYSYLRSVEDLLGLDGHLGYAGRPRLSTFGSDIFTNPAGGAPPAGAGGGASSEGSNASPASAPAGQTAAPGSEILAASPAPSEGPPTGPVGGCTDVPLRVGIRAPRGQRIVRASVAVEGHVVARRRGRAMRTVVIPRPQSDVTIHVIAVTSKGKRLRSVRAFRGCRLGRTRRQ